MRVCSKLILYGLIFLIFIVSFFSRYINYYQAISILSVPFCFALTQGLNIGIGKRWYFYFFAITTTGLLGLNLGESIKFIFLFISITVLSGAAKNVNNYRDIMMKWFFWLSVLHTIVVLLQYFMPNTINPIIAVMVSGEVAERAIQANLLNGVCTGFAGEASFAMLYTSITFFLGFLYYLVENKKIYLIFVIVGLICTLLTAKRIAIAINVLAVVSGYVLLVKSKRIKQKNSLFSILFLLFVGIAVLSYTNLAEMFTQKNEMLLESGDLSNGRAELNAKMIQIFQDHMILGIGPYCTTQYTGEYLGHNIYLTTLSECGILGFIALVVLLLLNFKDTLLRFLKGDNSIYMYTSLYIQLFFIIYGFTGNPLYGTQFLATYILFAINENRSRYIPSCK